ncbi:hypothetical protein AHiyo8_26280 [Arthrobacter sp. Hiyo8]|nr:hypothetical protein AHiyo8_26280 [Arthrobacter sp. Hiyo8]GAP59222.1 hypothetical protein AHiyo1_24730 [Arthrobacter sp. Hiyo1]
MPARHPSPDTYFYVRLSSSGSTSRAIDWSWPRLFRIVKMIAASRRTGGH